MQENFIYTHSILPQNLSPNLKETFRYAGYKNVTTSFIETLSEKEKTLATDAQNKIAEVMSPKSVFIKLPITDNSECYGLSSNSQIRKFIFKSTSLSKNLTNCHSVYLFAATLGAKVDLLIQKYSKIDTPFAVFLQGAGAMYIEEYCDALQNYILENENLTLQNYIAECENCDLQKGEQNTLAPRFSPGYGDVPLSTQKLFFALLKPEKIGLTLNDTFLMSPEKSVTAFVGVRKAVIQNI